MDTSIQEEESRETNNRPPPFLGFVKYLFCQFMSHVANYVGMDVEIDRQAKILCKWDQLYNGFSLPPDRDRVETREYFVSTKTKYGLATIRVSKKTYDKVSYGDRVESYTQRGRYDDSKLNGVRIIPK
jgi:hypothetical protein